MKANKSTYGWKAASDLSDEVLEKDKSIENDAIKTLEAKVAEVTKTNENLEEEVAKKDDHIKTLEAKITELTKLAKATDDKAPAKKK